MFTFSQYSADLNINSLIYVQRSAIVEYLYNKKSHKNFKNTKVYYLQLTGLTVNVVLKYFKFATFLYRNYRHTIKLFTSIPTA